MSRGRQRLHEMVLAIIPNAIKRAGMAYAGVSTTTGKQPRRRGAGGNQAIVADHFRQGNTQRFGYEPNSPQYDAWKAQRFPGAPQMVRTGRLRQSVLGRGKVTVADDGASGRIRWTGLPAYVAHLIARKMFNLEPDSIDQQRIDAVAQESVRQDITALRVAMGSGAPMTRRVAGGQAGRMETPPLSAPPMGA